MSDFIYQSHDLLFKSMMSDKQVAIEFFKTHLPSDLLNKIDLSTLTLLSTEQVDQVLKSARADCIFKVALKNGRGDLYIVCEHQSTPDYWMSFRFPQLSFKLLDKIRNQKRQEELPLVFYVVIYSGKKRWRYPREFFDLFGKNKKQALAYFCQPFHLIDLCRTDDPTQDSQPWSGLFQFLLKYHGTSYPKKQMRIVLEWISRLNNKGGEKLINPAIHYLINGMNENTARLFLQEVTHYASDEIRRNIMTFAEILRQEGRDEMKSQMMTLSDQFRQEGRDEMKNQMMILSDQLRQEVINQEKQKTIFKLLSLGFDLKKISEITELSHQEIINIVGSEISA